MREAAKEKKNRARIDSQTRHLCLLRSCPISRLKSIQISQEVFFSFELWAELIGRDHLVSTYFTLHSYKCGSSENYLQTWFIAIIHYDNICWLLQTLTEKGSYIKTFQLMLLFFSWTLKMTKTSKMIWSTDQKCPIKVLFIKTCRLQAKIAKICGISRSFVKMCPYFMIWKPIWSVQHFTCLKFE